MRLERCDCGEPARVYTKTELAICKTCDRQNTYVVLWLAALVRPTDPTLAEILVRCVDGRWYRVAAKLHAKGAA